MHGDEANLKIAADGSTFIMLDMHSRSDQEDVTVLLRLADNFDGASSRTEQISIIHGWKQADLAKTHWSVQVIVRYIQCKIRNFMTSCNRQLPGKPVIYSMAESCQLDGKRNDASQSQNTMVSALWKNIEILEMQSECSLQTESFGGLQLLTYFLILSLY